MAKGGKETKKKAAKKAAKRKINTSVVTEAVGSLLESLALMSRAGAHIKAAVNVLNDELELGLDTAAMTAFESQHHTKPAAPLKRGAVPQPEDGNAFTAEELGNPGVFTRQVLSSILTNLGTDPVGKMPPALRTAIMEAQGGRQELGTCDFTGDENVAVEGCQVDGEHYSYGPAVAALLSGKSGFDRVRFLQKIVDGEIEV